MFEKLPEFKDYEVLGELGEGAQGKVYKVRWQNRKREVFGALKFLNSQEFKGILKEVSSWARVSQHPNILTFLGADEDDGRFFTISELATEGDLEKWIEEKGGKEEFFEEAIEIMLGVLSGLEHLHQSDIVHRDIKPANIFLMGKTPLLADFGLARGLDLKQSSILGGTLAYMSPELINVYLSLKAHKKLNYERTELDDLWAVAATFQQMLTGEMPFENIDSIRFCQPNPISIKVFPQIANFLKTAFAKNSAERFQTAEEMRKALNDIIEISNRETIIDEDFARDENLVDEPTRDWREIEAENKRQLELEEKQRQAEEQARLKREAEERQRQEAIEQERLRQLREMEAEEYRQKEFAKQQRLANLVDRGLKLGIKIDDAETRTLSDERWINDFQKRIENAEKIEQERQKQFREMEAEKERQRLKDLKEQTELDELKRQLAAQKPKQEWGLGEWVVGSLGGVLLLILGFIGINSLPNNNSNVGNANNSVRNAENRPANTVTLTNAANIVKSADNRTVANVANSAANSTNNYFDIAYDCYEKKRYDCAIQNYTKWIEQNPDDEAAYINRGIAYQDNLNYEQAIKDCNKAIELNPTYANAYNIRGNVYIDKGNYDQAIKDYNKAIELKPDYAEACNNRGVYYHKRRNYPSAVADYRKALQINPNYQKAKENLEIVLNEKNLK